MTSKVLHNTIFKSKMAAMYLALYQNLTLFGLEGGEGGGGGAGVESVRADFNFRELPWYLSNTYQMWPLLLEFVGEQDSGKSLRQRYHILPWQPRIRHHVYSNFDFFSIFLHYLTNYLKQGLVIRRF